MAGFRISRSFLLVSLLVLILSACGPVDVGLPDNGGDADLGGTSWRLVSYGSVGTETDIIEETQPTLLFETDNEVTGFTGCNDFAAQYAVTNGSIVFSQIVRTEIFCTVEGVMDQEEAYLGALETAETFEMAGDELRIYYGDGQRVLNFVRAEADGG